MKLFKLVREKFNRLRLDLVNVNNFIFKTFLAPHKNIFIFEWPDVLNNNFLIRLYKIFKIVDKAFQNRIKKYSFMVQLVTRFKLIQNQRSHNLNVFLLVQNLLILFIHHLQKYCLVESQTIFFIHLPLIKIYHQLFILRILETVTSQYHKHFILYLIYLLFCIRVFIFPHLAHL